MKNQVTSQMSSPSSETQSSAVRGPGTKSAARCAAVFLDPRRLCLPAADRGDDASEAGNIFVWIFIMVALFGALSFAMMQGTRSGSSQLTDQQLKLTAGELVSYGHSLREAVRQLRINGCSDTQITFQGHGVSGAPSYTNPNAPADMHCHVFKPQGGGMMYQDFEDLRINSAGFALFSAQHCYVGVGTHDSNCLVENKELEFNVLAIPKNLCIEINREAGLGISGADPNGANYSANTGTGLFLGAYINPSNSFVIGLAQNPLPHFGCYVDTVGAHTGYYVFYYILLAR